MTPSFDAIEHQLFPIMLQKAQESNLEAGLIARLNYFTLNKISTPPAFVKVIFPSFYFAPKNIKV